jgi:hypothetical protein
MKMAKLKRTLYNKNKPDYKGYLKRHDEKYSGEPISKELFEKLILEECVYCGFKPDGKTSWNSLDRFDSSKGYTKDNVYPCCKHCNYAKGSLDFNLFKEWVERLANHFSNKKGIWSKIK